MPLLSLLFIAIILGALICALTVRNGTNKEQNL